MKKPPTRRNSNDDKGQESLPGVAQPTDTKPRVQRRKSNVDTTAMCEMRVSHDEVQPFTQVEVKWKLKGVKANDADWIGMYEGTQVPEDIDNYVSSMMANGHSQGGVKFTAPNHPGLHHFRYFLLDDTEAAVSTAFTITKLDRADAEENIHTRDAILAENEVLRLEGKVVEDDFEDEESSADGGGSAEGKAKKKKPKSDEPRVIEDMTGFTVDDDSQSMQQESTEKWKEDAQRAKDEAAEQTMQAATHFTKNIPTKKEMRAAAAAKLAGAPGSAPNRSSQEGTGDAPKKAAGWGKIRTAVSVTAAFKQGRANKGEDTFKNRKKTAKPVSGGDDMGSFVINRGKK